MVSGINEKASEPPMAEVPADHVDLLQRPLVAALTTLLPDGHPQTQPVWYSYDPPSVLINTMRGFRKERNMRSDPRVTLLVLDPLNSSRWIELRGLVQLIDSGAGLHLDLLAQRYASKPKYFGGCVSAELAQHEIPVIGRIRPVHVVDERSANRRRPLTRTSARHSVHPRSSRASLPASHQDLLSRRLVGILSTLMPDGHPQTEPVWFDWDGQDVAVNTTRERQKGRNLQRDPRATLLIIDAEDSSRWMEVRGAVEITETGATAHLDRLTLAYTSWPRYYGYVRSVDWMERETRIICRLLPSRVVCDAIHRPPSSEQTRTG